MDYKIEFSQNAKKDLDRLENEISTRILKKLREIKANPHHHSKRLVGSELWSLRVGDHRVLFIMTTDTLFVVKIGHRKDVYE